MTLQDYRARAKTDKETTLSERCSEAPGEKGLTGNFDIAASSNSGELIVDGIANIVDPGCWGS